MEGKPYNILLENDFDRLEELAKEAAEAAKVPTFSEKEVMDAAQDAYIRGKNDGLRDALNNQEERIALSLENLTQRFDDLITRQTTYEYIQQKEAIFIAINMVKKIMPRFVETKGVEEIKAIFEKALRNNVKETELLLKVNAAVYHDVKALIDKIAQESGYSRISVKEDNTLNNSDCIIEWGNGGIARLVPLLWQEIEEQVSLFLNGQSIEDYLSQGFETQNEEPTIKETTEEITGENNEQ